MIVRSLLTDDIDGYVHHVAEVDAESGVGGAAHSHPYGRSELRDRIGARDLERVRWTTDLDEPAWRRAWGLFGQGELIGYLYLAGGSLLSQLHRVEMGVGVASSHRRRGGGHTAVGSGNQVGATPTERRLD